MVLHRRQAAVTKMMSNLLPRRRAATIPHTSLDELYDPPLTFRKLLCHTAYRYGKAMTLVNYRVQRAPTRANSARRSGLSRLPAQQMARKTRMRNKGSSKVHV